MINFSKKLWRDGSRTLLLIIFIFSAVPAQALTISDLTAELITLETKAQNIAADIIKAKNDPQTTTATLDKLLVDIQTTENRTQIIKGLLATAPSAPTVTVSPSSSCGGTLKLTYAPPSKGTVLKYDLNRNPDGTQTASWGVVAEGTDIKTFTAIDQGLKPDTIYKYQLRAVGPGEIEAYSEIVQAKSSVACPPPPPPVCPAPLTQNVTVACDLKNGISATSGLVTRSQTKSAYPSCAFATPVTVDNSKYENDDCLYLPVTYELRIINSGSGTVTSAPAGINCGSDCSESYNSNTSVTLISSPATGWRFVSWSGACSNSTGNCVVAMNNAKNVTANFFQNSVDTGGSSSTTIITTTPPPPASLPPPVVVTTPPPITPTPPASATTTPPAAATPPPATAPAVATLTPQPPTTQPPIILTTPATTPPATTTPTPAATTPNGQSGLVPCDNSPSKPCNFNAFMKLIDNIMKFILFALAVPIAAIMFAYAGFKLITSGGSTEARGQAKKIFTHAALGIVVAAGAWLIVKTILDVLGYKGDWIGF